MSTGSSPGFVYDIPALLAQGMGEQLHWYPEDVPAQRLAVTLAGMANASGGVVLIGVAPRSRDVHGVRDVQDIRDRVFQAALLCDPPLVLPIPLAQPMALERPLVVVTVPAGLPHVYSLDGRYWGREGAQTNPLPARKLRQLLLERGVVQFETRTPPQAGWDDLDPALVQEYVELLHLPPGTPPAEALLRRGCLQKVEGSLCPTYAALLLFGRYPQQWLPGATLLAARFAGQTFSDQFVKQEIGGTLPQQLRQAEAFLRDSLRSVVHMKGLAHAESPEYPFEAVRELLVNAVAHRDYNMQGDGVHVHIFVDRLEVHSPGGLPGPVTLQNLLQARFSRNAVITQVLADMGFVERLGYGLDRVVAALQENGQRPPRFEEIAGSFRVTLFNDLPAARPSVPPLALQTGLARQAGLALQAGAIPAALTAGEEAAVLEAYRSLNLNLRQQAALVFMSRRQRITNRDYQELCPDVHAETLRRDLADLASRGVILKIGDKRATYYILKRLPGR